MGSIMKYFWAFLLLPVHAIALDCRLDGISDSPQEMNCYIHENRLVELLDLKCLDGNYFLRWKNKYHPVDVAYHEEVDSGSSPLVFRSGRLSLTSTLFPMYSKADLMVDDERHDGLCFNKVSP